MKSVSARWLYWPGKCSKDNINVEDRLILFPEDAPGISHQELYTLTYEQLAKDFYPYLTLSRPEGLIDAEKLYRLVYDALQEIITNQASSLGPILYRIDISERSLKKEKAQTSAGYFLHVFTQKILRQEARKVWLRKTLS